MKCFKPEENTPVTFPWYICLALETTTFFKQRYRRGVEFEGCGLLPGGDATELHYAKSKNQNF